MTARWLLVGAMVAAAALSLAQTPTAPAIADFAGTWTAEFHKQVWLTLTLVPEKGALSGTLMHSVQISADNEGDLTKVDDEMTSDKVVRVELRGDTLHVDTRDEDGSMDSYRMVLTSKDAAELRTVTSDGENAPKPFKLKRAPSSPTQK